MRQLPDAAPGAAVEFQALDLGSLAAIREVAGKLCADTRPLDLLVNNAGLLPPQQRATTTDGFELGFGVSVLGHYALTGLLRGDIDLLVYDLGSLTQQERDGRVRVLAVTGTRALGAIKSDKPAAAEPTRLSIAPWGLPGGAGVGAQGRF